MKVIRLHFLGGHLCQGDHQCIFYISFVLNSVLEPDLPMNGHKMLLNQRIMVYFPSNLVSHSCDHRIRSSQFWARILVCKFISMRLKI